MILFPTWQKLLNWLWPEQTLSEQWWPELYLGVWQTEASIHHVLMSSVLQGWARTGYAWSTEPLHSQYIVSKGTEEQPSVGDLVVWSEWLDWCRMRVEIKDTEAQLLLKAPHVLTQHAQAVPPKAPSSCCLSALGCQRQASMGHHGGCKAELTLELNDSRKLTSLFSDF